MAWYSKAFRFTISLSLNYYISEEWFLMHFLDMVVILLRTHWVKKPAMCRLLLIRQFFLRENLNLCNASSKRVKIWVLDDIPQKTLLSIMTYKKFHSCFHLCLMKWPSEMLQNMPYIWNYVNQHSFFLFSFRATREKPKY